mmetsp:Transcript_9408/g.26450  ORF Transcript_9408/g.26450 Transcript_9408/m.26450 type:complete len:200 (+) Transcript_9408:780-1379(+)
MDSDIERVRVGQLKHRRLHGTHLAVVAKEGSDDNLSLQVAVGLEPRRLPALIVDHGVMIVAAQDEVDAAAHLPRHRTIVVPELVCERHCDIATLLLQAGHFRLCLVEDVLVSDALRLPENGLTHVVRSPEEAHTNFGVLFAASQPAGRPRHVPDKVPLCARHEAASLCVMEVDVQPREFGLLHAIKEDVHSKVKLVVPQ